METKFFYNTQNIDKNELFHVYHEGMQKNAEHYHEPLEEIEKAHWEYLTDFLEKRSGFLAVLTEDEKYYAALRVLPKGKQKFYCEAFEVLAEERGKGFGKKLYRDVIKHISENCEHFELEAHTWQTNTASIKSHLGVGFQIEKNYVVRDDGSKDDFGVTLCMKK